MGVPASAKRLGLGTAVVLIALLTFTPGSLLTNDEAEQAQPDATPDPYQAVLGTSVEGVIFRISSDTATTAGLLVDEGRGPELFGVELPYVGRVDENAPIVIVNASVGDGASVKCSIERNATVLEARQRGGNVECSELLSEPQLND